MARRRHPSFHREIAKHLCNTPLLANDAISEEMLTILEVHSSFAKQHEATALRSANKLAPERQRMSMVRHSGMSWNTLLNLDNFIVMPTFPPHCIYQL